MLPPEITEVFLARQGALLGESQIRYRPGLIASARVHFTQKSAGVDETQDLTLMIPAVDSLSAVIWDQAEVLSDGEPESSPQPDDGAVFESPPVELTRAKTFAELTVALKNHIYRTQRLEVWKCPELKEYSRPGETEGDFRARLTHGVHEERDAAKAKLQAKYAPKLATLTERLRKAQQRLEKEKTQSANQAMQTVVTVGSSILGALFGRKLASAANVGRASTTIRSASKTMSERQDVAQAAESVQAVQAMIDKLNQDFDADVATLQEKYVAEDVKLERVSIAPKKTDITVVKLALAWTPWIVNTNGSAEAAY